MIALKTAKRPITLQNWAKIKRWFFFQIFLRQLVNFRQTGNPLLKCPEKGQNVRFFTKEMKYFFSQNYPVMWKKYPRCFYINLPPFKDHQKSLLVSQRHMYFIQMFFFVQQIFEIKLYHENVQTFIKSLYSVSPRLPPGPHRFLPSKIEVDRVALVSYVRSLVLQARALRVPSQALSLSLSVSLCFAFGRVSCDQLTELSFLPSLSLSLWHGFSDLPWGSSPGSDLGICLSIILVHNTPSTT